MMSWPSIEELRSGVASKEKTAVQLTEEALSRIEDAKDLNALTEVTADYARKRALQLDQEVEGGEGLGRPLLGVPCVVKDNYLTFAGSSTASSNFLKGYKAPYQSTVVTLLEAAGAVIVGKANLDAFAHGASTENSDYGVSKNPHDKTRVPGGSSGGSAAAVAGDLVPFALGSDTGGSIRQPAALTGTVGYKPSYGVTSRYGVVAMASSTDVMGVLAASVEDASIVMSVIAAKDAHDGTTVDRPIAALRGASTDLTGVKIGVIKEHLTDDVQPEIMAAHKELVEKAKKQGAEVREVSLPSLDLALAVYYVLVPAEVSSNLARYDGVRYGNRAEAKGLSELYLNSRSEGFNDENKRRLMIGAYVLSSGYYDAYYKKAQQVRTLLIQEFSKAFEEVDFLIGPTTPTTAFKIGEKKNDPILMYLNDLMTIGMSLAGLPAISIPAGKDAESLPVGMQLTAPLYGDSELLAVAYALEGGHDD